MKISAINSTCPITSEISVSKTGNLAGASEIEQGKNFAISFKAGNPRHIAHAICEEPLFGIKGGGVGTVSNDYDMNTKGYDKVIKFLPLYNQDVVYDKAISDGVVVDIKQKGVKILRIPKGLPENHPFKKYEGFAFLSPNPVPKGVNLADFLAENNKNIFVLEELCSSKMEWGFESKSPIAAFRAVKNEQLKEKAIKAGMKEDWEKLEWIFTYVDSTGSMAKPYADGSYQTATGGEYTRRISADWQGKPYAKYDKALVELKGEICKKTGLDPAYILCSDSQMQPIVHYAALKNAAGDPNWLDVALGAVGHNMNNGYLESLTAKEMVVCLATKDELNKILNSREYLDAVKQGRAEEFFTRLIPKELRDDFGKFNMNMFAITYAEKGYVPMYTTVSDNYAISIANNELVSPAIHKRIKALAEASRFKGILNVLMDPTVSGFGTAGFISGYKDEAKIRLKNGQEKIITPFLAFDKDKAYDIKHIREIKHKNLLNLLERFSPELDDAEYYNAASKKWEGKNTGAMHIRAGLFNKEGSVVGRISPEYYNRLAKGEDIAAFTCWARGDFQKGIDTALQSFEKFVEKTGNKDSILLLGGDMENLPELVQMVESTKLKGRVMLFNGFTPGNCFASASDYAILPSRFAPCELTDLEAIKYACVPIVPKVQGMDQKIFDPSDPETKFANGYKGSHEYYMTIEEAYKETTPEARSAYDKVYNTMKSEIIKDYKNKIGEEPSEVYIKRQLETNQKYEKKYNKAVKALRDSVIVEDMSKCMERAIADRNTEVASKLLKNHVDLKTTWEENGWLTPEGKSSAELYREYHFNNRNFRNLNEGDAFRLKLDKLHDLNPKKEDTKTLGSRLRHFAGKPAGRCTIGLSAAAVLAAATYKIVHKKCAPEVKEKESDNLALIG